MVLDRDHPSMRAGRPMKVAIVVLNWNNGPATLACLEAVGHLRYGERSLYVVDNGSTDGSPDLIRSYLVSMGQGIAEATWGSAGGHLRRVGDPEPGASPVTLILVDRNLGLGYGGGNNVGLRLALADGADAVWVLNNDAQPEASALDIVVATARLDPTVGFVGVTVLVDDPAGRVQCVGGGRYRWATSRTSLIGSGMEFGDVAQARLPNPDFVTGAAIFLTRQLLIDVGGFEEGYHLCCEEIDLATRARKRGWRTSVARDAQVRHQHGSTAGSNLDMRRRSQASFYYGARSAMLLTRKFRPALIPIVAFVRSCYALSLYSKGMSSSARAVVKGTADGLSARPVGDVTLHDVSGSRGCASRSSTIG